MATLKTGTTIAGQTPWHAGNDGSGSGLDADTVDGLQATSLRATVGTVAPSSPRTGALWVRTDEPLLLESDWVYPTFENGWGNYHSTWAQCRYCKLLGGLVFIEGMVGYGTVGASCFTLPVGYRPAYYIIAPSVHQDQLASIFHVYPDGRVIPYWVNGGGNAWHSIHGTFFAEG